MLELNPCATPKSNLDKALSELALGRKTVGQRFGI